MTRTFFLSAMLVALATVAQAQDSKDTTFLSGPQYLITTGSPVLLHPIATPSISLDRGLPPVPETSAPESSSTTSSSAQAPDQTFLGSVYWGDHADSQIVGRRLTTPEMTPSETSWYMNRVANAVASKPPASTALEVSPGPSVIEITSTQLPANLPASILDVGVTGTADAESTHEREYGRPLGDVAAYWKTHKGSTPHIYTNSDLSHLHGG